LIWEDINTANLSSMYTQSPNFNALFAKQYKVGSVSGRINIPFDKQTSFTASGEYAGSNYQDDLNNSQRVFEDWAALVTGALNVYGVHLTAKYVNNGPFFYSPGAQTNRYTPGTASGYLSTNANEDEFLMGYLNRYVFPGVNRPAFAPYDRMIENMLPYGDASPNRMGTVLGFSANIGEKGWLKPQASYVLKMEEIQPNLVLSPDSSQSLAVESATTTANARTFSGYEGALTISFSKAYGLDNKTYQLAADYKHQETDLGLGTKVFKVDTMIGTADFNLPISGFDSIMLSVAYGQTKSSGYEYILANSGNPPTLGQFPFYLDTNMLNAYTFASLDITKTSWAFGLLYPVVTDMNIRGDYFINEYTWKSPPAAFAGYYRRDQIWRLTYEVHF
jgi:hypothetical protein